MKIAIFGATGSIGSHLVEQALTKGHEVTAFVRNPDKLKATHDKLTFVVGDVVNQPLKVEEAVEGQDAVLIALGAGLKGRVRAEGTRNIIAAMEKRGVSRLICQSTLGAGESDHNLNLKWKLIFRLPLRLAMADHERQESLVRNSGLDWTIVRPSSFTDEPMTGDYQFGFPPEKKKLKLTIPRADVAHFMIRIVGGQNHLRKAVALSH